MLRRASASLSSQVCARRVLTRAFCAGPDFTSSLHWWKNGKDEDAFTGGKPGGLTEGEYTNRFKDIFPCYRVMDEKGQVADESHTPDLSETQLVAMYEKMNLLNTTDKILYDAQRQGRISFYMTSFGEEAIHIGSSAALDPEDEIFAQYRELGVLMWRGFTVEQVCNQCFSNELDNGKGRQMPVHYGSKELHFQTISSPLATQIPQAAGAAYAMKLAGMDKISVCYFGEGAASEGDFHAALNIASTMETPTIFFCRNNGYAISTPTSQQYRGDGIAVRGPGYGINTIRVDGNDLFAVYNAVQKAREMIMDDPKPVLIEAMTYRGGHHSTSDDSTRYRSIDEIKVWQEQDNPLTRLRIYLEDKNFWDADKERDMNKRNRKEVMTAMQSAESRPKPGFDELFSDVFDEVPQHLLEQKAELIAHVQKHKDAYPDMS